MQRVARKKSESGYYHIVLRGINKQALFYDDEDKEVFFIASVENNWCTISFYKIHRNNKHPRPYLFDIIRIIFGG